MNSHQKQLGWVEGSAAEFLGLSPAQEQFCALKIALSSELRAVRGKAGTQREVAERLGIEQPQLVRLEAGTASLDAIIEALLKLGVSVRKLAHIVANSQIEEDAPAPVTNSNGSGNGSGSDSGNSHVQEKRVMKHAPRRQLVKSAGVPRSRAQ